MKIWGHQEKSVHVAQNRFARPAAAAENPVRQRPGGGENLVSTRPEGGSKIIFALDLYEFYERPDPFAMFSSVSRETAKSRQRRLEPTSFTWC